VRGSLADGWTGTVQFRIGDFAALGREFKRRTSLPRALRVIRIYDWVGIPDDYEAMKSQ
jgi:hypothetical protein